MAEYPFLTLMREKATQALTIAQGAQVALEASPHKPEDIQALRTSGALLVVATNDFLGAAAEYSGLAERATTAFADGLRLMGAGLLNMADGIEQQDAGTVQQGQAFYAAGSQQVRKAFEIMGEEPPTAPKRRVPKMREERNAASTAE